MVHLELASLIFDYDIHFSPIKDALGHVKELEPWKMNLVAAGGNMLFVTVGDRVLVRALGEHTGELLESQPNALWLKPPCSSIVCAEMRGSGIYPDEESETAAYREKCCINAIRMVSIWDAEDCERQYLLTANGLGDISLFDLRNLQKEPVMLATNASAWSVAVDGGRATLFVGNNSHKVHSFSLSDPLPKCMNEIPWQPIIEHDHNVPSVDVTPDGNLIASYSIDGTCRIFNAINGATIKAPLGNQWGWACRWVSTRGIDQLTGPVTFLYDGPDFDPSLEIDAMVIENVLESYEGFDEFLLGQFGGNEVDGEDEEDGLDEIYSLNDFELRQITSSSLLDDFSDMRAIDSAYRPSLVPEDAWADGGEDSAEDGAEDDGFMSDTAEILQSYRNRGIPSPPTDDQLHRTIDIGQGDSSNDVQSPDAKTDPSNNTDNTDNTDIIGNWARCLSPEHWMATYGPPKTSAPNSAQVQIHSDSDWITESSGSSSPARRTSWFDDFFRLEPDRYESEYAVFNEYHDDSYDYSDTETGTGTETETETGTDTETGTGTETEDYTLPNSNRLAIFETDCSIPQNAFLLALCSEHDLMFLNPGSGDVVHRIADLVHCFELPGRIHTNPLWLSMNRLSLIQWIPTLSTLFVASQVGVLIACHLNRLPDGHVQFTCVSFPELYRASPMAGFTVYPRHADGGPHFVAGWLLHVVYLDAHEITLSLSRKPKSTQTKLPKRCLE